MTNSSRIVVRALCVTAIAIAATLFCVPGLWAQEPKVPISDCFEIVGTYLTVNTGKDKGGGLTARSLVSITNGGHVFLTDSNEEGISGFAPYGDARGAWRCVTNDGGVARLKATVMHFTRITPSFRDQKIGRLDIDASFDPDNKTLTGTMTLYLVPIDADPLGKSNLKPVLHGPFTGQRIVAP